MLCKVDLHGQLSLGVEHAGRSYTVVSHADGRIELTPAVLSAAPVSALGRPPLSPPVGWKPPGGYDAASQWARENWQAVEYHARQIEENGTAAEQLQRFLAAGSDGAKAGDGEI